MVLNNEEESMVKRFRLYNPKMRLWFVERGGFTAITSIDRSGCDKTGDYQVTEIPLDFLPMNR